MPNDMTNPPDERKPANFPAMLKTFQTEIARALPKHMNPDRMARIALTAFRSTPKLAECDPKSVFAAVIQSSQLGLEVGLMGEAHLVPFKGTCQLIPGYQGLIKLARNSGLVEDIYAHEVRQNDKFEAVFGLARTLVHEPLSEHGFPASDERRGAITGFYAVAVFKDGSKTFAAMSKHEVDRIRDGSRGYQMAKQYKKESPWDTHYVEMGKKTAIRRLCKLMPKSPELAQALALDTVADNGRAQNITVDDAIDGVWAPAADDAADEPEQPKPAGQGPTLPEFSAEAFEKSLPAFAKSVKKGKSPDDIIAMLATKNSLDAAQIARIRALAGEPEVDGNAPASDAQVIAIFEDGESAGFGHDRMCAAGGVTNGAWTLANIQRARAFLANPMGAPE